LELTLIELSHTGGRKIFRDFLRCEYSEENILFWLACEELKQETNPEAIEEKARYIYEDYISILSPKEVRPGRQFPRLSDSHRLPLVSGITRFSGKGDSK
jgi:Regulator of G protein signaling domain